MSSKVNCKDERVLDAIFAELDEGRIRKRIDEPIEAVFQKFVEDLEDLDEPLPGREAFVHLVRDIYRDGLRAPWKVPDPEATTLMLLENHYRGLQSQGYSAAILDATGPAMGGMMFVLTQLVEIIRAKERQEYVAAVFVRQIDPSNWRLRCEMVELLLKRYRAVLPPALLECPVWQLVDEIPAMILRILSSCSAVIGIASPHSNPPSN